MGSPTSIENVFGTDSGGNRDSSGSNYKSVKVFNPRNAGPSGTKDIRRGWLSKKKQSSSPKAVVTSGLRNLEPEVPREKGLFLWPVDGGTLSSAYGWRTGRRFHDGIDISARAGTRVYASMSGTVIYSSAKIRGYGNMIVIKHTGGFYTVYAHNSENKVGVGATVSKGEHIAYVGKTGRASGTHLHFEIRKGKYSVDPAKYLNIDDGKTKLYANPPENKMISTFTN
ncbi:MAG: M23 family metallopeptidase [Oligoflexia bacterium]|nr:M23 family metallopeptidase [Oligoflexia bacterium]